MSVPRDGNGPRPLDLDADQPDRPESGSAADLRQRLGRLPPGHPSSPMAADGSARRPLPSLSYLEVQLADKGDDAPDDGRMASDGNASGPPEDGPSEDSILLRGAKTWRHEVPRLLAIWEDIKARWPREANPRPDRSGDDPGSWRGDSGRLLSASQNRRIDAWCDDVSDCEQRITGRLEEVERASPGQLVGKEYRIKGRDRLKDKIAAVLEHNSDADVDHVLAHVPDVVRYTMQYGSRDYTHDVGSDLARLKAHGFELVKLKNLWENSEYKGINSQWCDTTTGLQLEVQFHTLIGFEAKQITHAAYERMRSPQTTDVEAAELKLFQQEVTARIPLPSGALDIPEFP